MHLKSSGVVFDVRRVLLAVIAVLALCVSVMFATSGTARAACATGDFCIYENSNLGGGKYNFSGSDQNLSNDNFVGGSGGVVNNAGSSVENIGVTGAFDDVLAYDALFYGAGATICFPNLSSWLNLAIQGWDNRISSFAWVNSC